MREVPTIDEPVPVLRLSAEETAELSREVRALAVARHAVILAHNYQVAEIQAVADFVGDSLALSRQAVSAEADVIAFCGVHFMAETASILSPQKTVLIPDPEAGCSLSDSITANELRNWKSRHPGAVVVMYVNTSAAVKAETDYCCTSSNAVEVVEHVYRERGPGTEILFGPDMWLGSYVERITGSRMHLWPGECHVHAGIRAQQIERRRAELPEAEVLIHPECSGLDEVLRHAGDEDPASHGIHVLSTGGMLRRVAEHPDEGYVVATETGMLDPLSRAAPRARLTAANPMAVCKYMKTITLPKLRDSLREMRFEVSVPPEVAERARTPIERMVSIG